MSAPKSLRVELIPWHILPWLRSYTYQKDGRSRAGFDFFPSAVVGIIECSWTSPARSHLLSPSGANFADAFHIYSKALNHKVNLYNTLSMSGQVGNSSSHHSDSTSKSPVGPSPNSFINECEDNRPTAGQILDAFEGVDRFPRLALLGVEYRMGCPIVPIINIGTYRNRRYFVAPHGDGLRPDSGPNMPPKPSTTDPHMLSLQKTIQQYESGLTTRPLNGRDRKPHWAPASKTTFLDRHLETFYQIGRVYCIASSEESQAGSGCWDTNFSMVLNESDGEPWLVYRASDATDSDEDFTDATDSDEVFTDATGPDEDFTDAIDSYEDFTDATDSYEDSTDATDSDEDSTCDPARKRHAALGPLENASSEDSKGADLFSWARIAFTGTPGNTTQELFKPRDGNEATRRPFSLHDPADSPDFKLWLADAGERDRVDLSEADPVSSGRAATVEKDAAALSKKTMEESKSKRAEEEEAAQGREGKQQ